MLGVVGEHRCVMCGSLTPSASNKRSEATIKSHNLPNLKEVVTPKPKKSKKTTLLIEFNVVTASKSRGLTHYEMLHLLTRPKECSSDEMHICD
ncbi:Plant specific eukaryotic initiation factor 4B [Sesbania bispinosa]|nr:Plant specific eukaryotic initiation factor 4B [Sesbania bispinosa]